MNAKIPIEKTKRISVKLANRLRALTIGTLLIANLIPSRAGGDPCASLGSSLMISAGALPDAAADQLGNINVVWQDPSLGIMYAQVGPDGTVTVPATSMYKSTGYGFPHIAVDSTGNSHIIATTFSFGGLIYIKVSGGKQVALNAFFMSPTLADNESDLTPAIAINPATQLPVVVADVQTELDEWEGVFDPIEVPVYSAFIASESLDNSGNPIAGSIFEAWYDLETATPNYDVSYPSVAVDNNGNPHVVWIYQDPSLSGLTVGYANSTTDVYNEIADTPNVSGLEGRPIIIRGYDGNLDVVWSTTASSVVWEQLNPQGVVLVDNSIVSQPQAIARWPGLASAPGQLVCSWTDSREGTNSQIYARSLLETTSECDVSDSPGAADNGAVTINSSGSPAYVWQDSRSGSAQLYCGMASTGVTVTGHVYCTCDGSPIADVLVQIGDYSATSASDGSYTVAGISPGTYSAVISQMNYCTTNAEITIPSESTTVTDDFTLKPNGKDSAIRIQILSGSLQWLIINNSKTLMAVFTPQAPGSTLVTAACELGYDHFNWYQRLLVNPPVPYPYSIPVPFNDPPQYWADGSPNLLTDPVSHLHKWPADALRYALNEGDNPLDPYDRMSPHHTSVDGTTLEFDDSPTYPAFGLGQYMQFVTTLVGIRQDDSYDCLDGFFFWKTDNKGPSSSGGIIPDLLTEWVDTNGAGGVFDLITNLAPADLPSNVFAGIIANGGAFPVEIQPAAQTVVSGGSVIFAISPTNSSSPLHYQWRVNGTNISDATNLSLQVLNVTTNSSGIYDAVLSNSNGVVTSSVALLTVQAAPSFQSVATMTNGIVLSWSAAQGMNYQLQYITNLSLTNWIDLGGPVTASNIVLSVTNAITSDEQRFYRVLQR
ncbi:MAG TPA: carboxypeptidase regulatory-like domain-containing protein [Verrucomicrobiae bacterium]